MIGRRSVTLLAVPLALVALAAGLPMSGCGSQLDPSDGGASSSGASGTSGASGASGTSGIGASSGGVSQYKELRISPQNAEVTVNFGSTDPKTPFTVKGITEDGRETDIAGGTYTFDRPDVAAFSGTSLVPTGFVGGKSTVTFALSGQKVSTTASFKLKMQAGTPPAQNVIDALDKAQDADPINLVYPYPSTVFPRGLPGPLVQWTGATVANQYRIRVTSSTFDFIDYPTIAAPGRYLFPATPADVWAKLADSTDGAVTISVQRYDGTKAFAPKTLPAIIAPGNLKGIVYYTRLIANDSFVQRIQPGKAAEPFLDKTGVQCIACHSVSKDGSRIVASVNGGESPWAVFDAQSGKKLYQSAQPSGFQAISPTGSHVLWRQWTNGAFDTAGKLLLSTSSSDAVLAEFIPPQAQGAPTHPVWSPDGNRIALAMRTNGNGLDFTASSLWVTDVNLTAAPPSFANTRRIGGGEGNLPVATYPTFSPDSKWVAFMRATKAKTDGDALGELWMTNTDGTVTMKLQNASFAPGTIVDRSWGPSFHPVATGGYFWVAFFSQRPYGNVFNGTNRQLWIAAVDANPKAGADPSHPAFYITGQNQDSTNERPQFALSPCQRTGSSCENGYDCCDGFCRAGGDGGALICQDKGAGCSQQGEKCTTEADCCGGLPCVGGFCSNAPK